MRIATYNINGIRAAVRSGFLEFVSASNVDIFCIQELRADYELASSYEMEFLILGYNLYLNPCKIKKGYSGTAIIYKSTLKDKLKFKNGFNDEDDDPEGRVIRVYYNDIVIFNVYTVNGHSRQELKYEKLMKLHETAIKESLVKNVIIASDYNTAIEEIDLQYPKRNQQTSGFLPEEREMSRNFLVNGFIDTFRHFHPGEKKYSWISYGARNSGKTFGSWRFDYIFTSNSLKEVLKDCDILWDVNCSDHKPVVLDIEI